VKPQDKAIARIKKYGSSEDFTIKKEVMKKLTKISKDQFMCQCCKKYFLPHFLSIDHIKGRKEITKNEELKLFRIKVRKTVIIMD